MNKGLEAPEFVFFFVTANSLNSVMVKLEWQNALYAASQGKTRIIPVRVDGSAMPAILMQTLYIDMHNVGLEAGIAQIVSVTQGNASFTPQHAGFSNLTWTSEGGEAGSILVRIKASHFMEPNPNFVLLLSNEETEVGLELNSGAPMLQGFYKKPFPMLPGNGFTIAPMGGAITPERPMRIKLMPKTPGTTLRIEGILHGWSEPFRVVPRAV